jgi:hypothetical protein
MLWYQNYWISAVCVIYIIIIKKQPQYPPSLVSLEEPAEAQFCQSLYEALKLPEYRRLLAIFSLMQGGFLAFGTNID